MNNKYADEFFKLVEDSAISVKQKGGKEFSITISLDNNLCIDGIPKVPENIDIISIIDNAYTLKREYKFRIK